MLAHIFNLNPTSMWMSPLEVIAAVEAGSIRMVLQTNYSNNNIHYKTQNRNCLLLQKNCLTRVNNSKFDSYDSNSIDSYKSLLWSMSNKT